MLFGSCKMTEAELDAFMEEFVKTLDDKNVNPNKLGFFMQLLLQMDSHLAERFMKEVSEKDVLDVGKRAKEVLDRAEEAECYDMHPLERLENVHPYKGLGFQGKDKK